MMQAAPTDLLPEFRYHPDPVATGNVEVSDTVCRCCGQQRGYIYVASVYAIEDLHESICPWCIADGSAAKKFKARFADSHPLRRAGIPKQIIAEVTQRTPGYISWQQEEWQVCCGDACAFLGDAPKDEVLGLKGEALHDLLKDLGWSVSDWNDMAAHYEPVGDPAVYKFACLHCKRLRYSWDCS